jgi:mono/diheme cytochrome c family protein
MIPVMLSSLGSWAEAPGDAAAGKVVFLQNCAPCHGADGRGDGPASAGLNPKPANFRDPERRQQMTPERTIRIVTNGGLSMKLSPVMPAFGEALTAKQIADVAAYITTALAPVQTATASAKPK